MQRLLRRFSLYTTTLMLCLLPQPILADEGSPIMAFSEDEGTLVTMHRQALGRDWLLASRIQDISKHRVGRLRLSPGQRLKNPLWIRFELRDKQLAVLRLNLRGNKLQAQDWMLLDAQTKHPDSLHVDLGPLMAQLHTDLDPVTDRIIPKRQRRGNPQITSRGQHTQGLELSLQQVYQGLSIQIRHSLYLLPLEPMSPRIDDARVGYYTTFTLLNERRQRSINRYRLSKGQHIKFWIDPRFPRLWRDAIAEGVRDWNTAFRAIGLGDVLETELYPTDSASRFDPDAMNVQTIRLVESDFPNAQGKHWVDPRSGEIIQSDILIFSEVEQLLRKWYFLETAAYNPQARQPMLPDSVLYRLVRYTAAHEVGHCLGLEHNYRASASFPVDSLRSPSFTDQMGTTPSIMDYARLNTIAQPGDHVVAIYPPLLGIYDRYAIAYGYDEQLKSDEELEQFVSKAQSNPYLRYEKLLRGTAPSDPDVQPFGLGDDGLKATQYALSNLRYILAHHSEWGRLPVSMDDIAEAYYRQLNRLTPYLNGIYRHTLDRSGSRVEQHPVSPKYQKRVRRFIAHEQARAKLLFPDYKPKRKPQIPPKN